MDTPLNKDIIANTSACKLYVRVTNSAADVMIYNPTEDNSLVSKHIALENSDTEAYLRSLENAVYDNPLILSDFAKTSVLIETGEFLLIPDCVTDSDLQEKLFTEAHPEHNADTAELLTDHIPALHATMLFAIDKKTVGFLRRAFVNPTFFHHQTPLLRYFADRRRHGNNAKMFVHLREKNMDVFVYGNDGLRMANTFDFNVIDDAMYYILAVRENLGMEQFTDELLISGDAALRRKILPELRRFISSVMPVIFPGVMFKAGKNALSVPFDLIVMPLCE